MVTPRKKPEERKPRGGPRPGSGRPVGSKSLQTLSKAANATVQKDLDRFGVKGMMAQHDGSTCPKDFTPLQVMVAAMRRAWQLGGPLFAFSYAKEAAPFMHAKLSAVEAKTSAPSVDGSTTMVDTPLGGVRVLVELVRPAPQPTQADQSGG